MKKKQFFHKSPGFLLIESLIAITILSIGLVLIVKSFSNSLYAAKLSNDYMAALGFIDQKMQELEGEYLSSGTTQGTFNDKFSWQIKVIPAAGSITEPFPEPGTEDAPKAIATIIQKISLNKVGLKVFWQTKKKQEEIILTTYLVQKTSVEDEESENHG